jgi:PAP2 superfamily
MKALKHNLSVNYATRALALVHVGLSDAMVATWDAKYAYQRPRPSDVDQSLARVVPIPASPSSPSEHAAAAVAASAILAYLFPDDAQLFADKADEADRSRLMAGAQWVQCAMDWHGTQRARPLDRDQSNSAVGGHLEDVGIDVRL